MLYNLVHQSFSVSLNKTFMSFTPIFFFFLTKLPSFPPAISQNHPVSMFFISSELPCPPVTFPLWCKNTGVLQLIRPLFTLFNSFMLKTHTREAGITGRSSRLIPQEPREQWLIGLLCGVPTWHRDYVWDCCHMCACTCVSVMFC